MLNAKAGLAAVLVAVGVGVGAFAFGGAADNALLDGAAEHRAMSAKSLDGAYVEFDTFDPREPAVVRDFRTSDDGLRRVRKPLVAAILPLALAWAVAIYWRARTPYGLAPRNVISQRAAARGPPVQLT